MWQFWQCGVALSIAPLVWLGLLSVPVAAKTSFTWIDFLLMAVFLPVLEELTFRGWLQGHFHRYPLARQQLAGLSVANLITSLIFTGLHFFYHTTLWAVTVFFPSLIFGYFRDKYQNVKCAIILHIFYNSGYYGLIHFS